MSKPEQFALFLTLVTAIAAFETAVLIRRRRRIDVKDSINSIAVGVQYLVINSFAAKALLLPAYLWVYDHRIFTLNAKSPITFLLCWIAADFVAYWTHRLEHTCRGLWASHSVHHSSEQYSMTTAVRMPWTQALYKPFIAFWVPLVGFHPTTFAVVGGLILATGQLQHTELVGKLGFLDRIFMTPSNHRVHHASNRIYLDKNFGATTVIWDKLFGTYQPELDSVKPVYGLTHPTQGTNAISISTEGLRSLLTDMRNTHSFRGGVGIFVGRP